MTTTTTTFKATTTTVNVTKTTLLLVCLLLSSIFCAFARATKETPTTSNHLQSVFKHQAEKKIMEKEDVGASVARRRQLLEDEEQELSLIHI